MDSLEVLGKLGKEKKLSLLERILAVTTGSVTQILEAHLDDQVRMRTLAQEVKEAGDFADKLGVAKKDPVNFREVELADKNGRVLMVGRSWTPVDRLEPEFKNDLMKADVPIGKLLAKHKIEARRELIDAWIENGKIRRVYNIIRNNEVLMRIEEEFERLD